MIVVSNTSPITNLAAIGQLDLLHKLFGRIELPQGVVDELTASGVFWPGAREVAQAKWIRLRSVVDLPVVDALRLDLDRGEAEAIALALRRKADMVLLDEQAGRMAAKVLGLQVMGVVGVVVRAKSKGHIVYVKPLLDGLRREAGFFLSEEVYLHALGLAAELPGVAPG